MQYCVGESGTSFIIYYAQVTSPFHTLEPINVYYVCLYIGVNSEYTSETLSQCQPGLITVLDALHVRMEPFLHSFTACYVVRRNLKYQLENGCTCVLPVLGILSASQFLTTLYYLLHVYCTYIPLFYLKSHHEQVKEPDGKYNRCSSCLHRASVIINLLTPNVNYSGRTAPLTSKVAFHIFIQQIYVLNILNMLYTLRFFLFKMQFVS